ncbi:MAG: PepSY domain-containing protein [Alphaproteobacteria bacterium]
MSKLVMIAVAGLMLAGAAAAQTPPANQSAPSNPAVADPSAAAKPGAPAAGANSFTEGQARSRIEAQGYSDVGPLTKDTDGVWRGKAMRSGQSVEVAVDYQGNVVAN